MKVLKWLLLIIIIALVIARLMAPSLIKKKANEKLATLPDYTGHVDDVHLAIWRGAFGLNDLSIKHKNGDMALTIKQFETRLHWMELLHRVVAADVIVRSPRVRMLVEKPSKAAEETKKKAKDVNKDVKAKTGQSLPDLLANMVPFRIERFVMTDGTIRVREKGQDINKEVAKDKAKDGGSENDDEKEDGLEARITDLNVSVENLTNTKKDTDTLMARGEVSAKIMDQGRFAMHLRLNPVAKDPTFKTEMEIHKIDLRALNPIFRWQWGVDVEKGTFEMTSEAAAAEGGFEGYVKPFIEDLKMVDLKEDAKHPVKLIKEAVVGAVSKVLSNSKEQVATKVPFKGRFEDPKTGIWEAIVQVLRNAFVTALKPTLDGDVHMKDLAGKFK